MLIEVFERAIFSYPVKSGLWSYIRDTRDVVRGITLKRQHVNKLFRGDSPFGEQRIGTGNFAGFYIVGTDVPVKQLEHILVPGADVDIDGFCGGFFCECSDYVVGLETIDSQDGDIHCIEDLLDAVNLGGQLIRHRGTMCLVFLVDFDSKGRGLAVHRHDEHIRLLILDKT